MKTFIAKCRQVTTDHLEGDVVGSSVFLSCVTMPTCIPSDVALTPTQARELAEWLERAAIEAEAYDDEP